MTERKPGAKYSRKALGHTEPITIKLHPDLKAHIDAQAEREYISAPEYVRRLIITDFRRSQNGQGES